MAGTSRTAKSIKNAKVALLFYFINLVLQFFSRKIFLDYLGAEVLGLNTTAQNLLGFLNLAELGIGSAVAFTLYKPIFEKDRQIINEIVSVQGWLYRRVAYWVIASACVLMCFFPLIFEKAKVPLWYTYGSFIVLLVGVLLSYFINYKQIVLSAEQKEYKITFIVKGIRLLKDVLQILAIYHLSNGYVYWMALELIMSGISTFILDKTLKREYPWLQPSIKAGGELRGKYPEIIIKVKQLFWHKIGGFVLSQTSPLIIYAYASLTLVAIYGNYMLIISGVISLMISLFNGINAGVGNLVAEGNHKHVKDVFWELASLRIWVSSIICFLIYKLGTSFIILWVGEEFVLEQSSFILLIAITFIGLTRVGDPFLAAYGLCHDVWAPVAEAILNLGLSVVLGYFYGLTGILSGVLISLLLIVYSWKPYFLYHFGFKDNFREYILKYLKILLPLLISFFSVSFWGDRLFDTSLSSYREWILYAVEIFILYILISCLLLAVFDNGMRACLKRFYFLIHR